MCSAFCGAEKESTSKYVAKGESIARKTVNYLEGTIMGLFGNDKEQDARIDALESHVRAISEAIQQTEYGIDTKT